MPSYIKLKCEICGQEISKSNMSKHLRRHEQHPETFQTPKYKVNHEGLECQFCGKLCKNINSLSNHERLCKLNPSRQESSFIAYNNKVSKGYKTVWNKGLTKDTDDRVLKYSLKLKGRKGRSGDDNSSKRLDVREKISKTCLNKSKQGLWHTSLAKDHHVLYKGQDFHSSWEVAFAKFLDSKSIYWERTKDRFPYYFEGKLRHYTPDFYINAFDTYVEIKGFKTEKDESKWSQFPANKKLKVLFMQDLIDIGVKIK